MPKPIFYEDRSVNALKPIFRTTRFSNLLSDSYQGEVRKNGFDDKWSGWFSNLSNDKSFSYPTEFRLDFKDKGAATKWVNAKLRRVLK